jgi:putative endopeptidase
MNKIMIISCLAAGVVAMSGCGESKKTLGEGALSLSNLETNVTPCEDFYQYACGGWIKSNPLGAEYARFGTFDQLRENNNSQVKSLVEGLQEAKQKPESETWKIAVLYAMGLDSTKLNKDGFAPVKAELDKIEKIKTEDEVIAMIAEMHLVKISPFFSLYVAADDGNSSMNIVQLYQDGLGMGDRDYYLTDNEANKKVIEAYKVYIGKLFEMTNHSPEQIKAAVDGVMNIEKQLAKISFSREELRDSKKNYNKVTVDELKSKSKPFNWDVYFKQLGLGNLKTLDAKQLTYYAGLASLLQKTDIEAQKYYLAFNLLNDAAPYLSDDFVNANFDFYGTALSGKQQNRPRWKRSLSFVNEALGEAVGHLYVDKYFPQSSKDKVLKIVGNLQKALSERIAGLQWMSSVTKAKAQEKLAAFTVKIGFPDKWRDYSKLEVKKDSYWNNVCRAARFEVNDDFAKIDKPVDKARWEMSPQTVNAYYSPNTNEICFPAAILQPPFFNPKADDAVNYGAIGVVIGHEMTHGFDDEGRNYDKNGNLIDWWTEEDAKRFNERADKLAKQYSDIIVADSVHANGRFTLGENIADQGGLVISHLAYVNSLKGKKRPEPIQCFTDEQRFYLSYAGLWAQNIRKEEILRLTKVDPHSLGKWRVNAALRNMDTFYKAFFVNSSDKMYMAPEERVLIW